MTAYRSFEKVPLPVEQVHSASKPRGTRFAFTAFIAHGAPLTCESDAGREIPLTWHPSSSMWSQGDADLGHGRISLLRPVRGPAPAASAGLGAGARMRRPVPRRWACTARRS